MFRLEEVWKKSIFQIHLFQMLALMPIAILSQDRFPIRTKAIWSASTFFCRFSLQPVPYQNFLSFYNFLLVIEYFCCFPIFCPFHFLDTKRYYPSWSLLGFSIDVRSGDWNLSLKGCFNHWTMHSCLDNLIWIWMLFLSSLRFSRKFQIKLGIWFCPLASTSYYEAKELSK